MMKDIEDLEFSEIINISGGGFAYDAGAVIGWFFRSQKYGPGNPAGIMYANAVWILQYR